MKPVLFLGRYKSNGMLTFSFVHMSVKFIYHSVTCKYVCEDPGLRYHGRWIFTKNGKNLFFAVQIEKTEINILPKKWDENLFYFSR